MYSAKQGGKGRHSTYEPEMHARVKHRQETISALTLAVERDEITVHYQPIVDLATGETVAVEALARWDRPTLGLVAPDHFIGLAEGSGLMVPIGRQVLREACAQVQCWRNSFVRMKDLRVTVNLAPSELMADDLVDDVAAILAATGLPADRLVLEITENGVMENPDEALLRMNEIRSLGVSLALDDFGTGHSSLAHLRGFPIDTLKIARDFVVGLPHSPVDRAFFETIVRLGRSLGLEVVAEGIESTDQARAIVELGCSLAQGFHFGQPLAPVGFTYALSSAQMRDRALRVA
jgi:EAL domain-containing protein (putative c-di-GMP-specific phosphodiesterase class I)